MMRRIITLDDGTEMPVSTPTIYVARTVHKLDPAIGIMTPADTQAALDADAQGFFVTLIAALLTAAEPWENGVPTRVWTPDEVAANLGSTTYGTASNVAVDLLYDFWGIDRPTDEEAAAIMAERAETSDRPNPKTPSRKRPSSRA